jgi:two-component system nitrogen regulation response regulator GlnG
MGKKDCTFEDVLSEKLRGHLSNIKHLKNGHLYDMIVRLVEKSLIKMILQETEGNQTQAAALLGINRNTLRRKLKELDIKV